MNETHCSSNSILNFLHRHSWLRLMIINHVCWAFNTFQAEAYNQLFFWRSSLTVYPFTRKQSLRTSWDFWFHFRFVGKSKLNLSEGINNQIKNPHTFPWRPLPVQNIFAHIHFVWLPLLDSNSSECHSASQLVSHEEA